MRPEDVEGLTVGGLLDLVVERRPDDDALVYADRNLRYTYREFKEVVERCARALMALGLERGDHVSVWGQNVPEWVILQFATGKVGAVLVTVNPRISPASSSTSSTSRTRRRCSSRRA
jgi:fatty-acyl-CoA synthase